MNSASEITIKPNNPAGPLLSVIIPAYNIEKYIEKLMNSLLENPEITALLEILIVNDGSKDSTGQIAADFQHKYPAAVHVITKENGGHGSAINAGIQGAKGAYIKVIDGDDWVDNREFTRLVAFLAKSDADLVLSRYSVVRMENDKETGHRDMHFNPEGGLYERTIPLEAVSLSYDALRFHAVTYRADILKRIKPITEKCYYVDIEYILYPLPLVKTLAYTDYDVYQYRIGASGQSVEIKSYIKNIKMHERVIRDLLINKGEGAEAYPAFYNERLAQMIGSHFEIIFAMKLSAENKNEMKEFAGMVSSLDQPILQLVPGKTLQNLMKHNFKTYLPLWLWKRIKRLITGHIKYFE